MHATVPLYFSSLVIEHLGLNAILNISPSNHFSWIYLMVKISLFVHYSSHSLLPHGGIVKSTNHFLQS